MSRKKIFIQWFQVAAGLFVFAFGIHLIGLAPWDCLSMGFSRRMSMDFGLAVTVISLSILGIDLLLKERIGFGTVLDALFTGPMIQFYKDIPEVMKILISGE